MQTKLFEIRDRGTYIPAMGIAFFGAEHPLLRAAGYAVDQHYVFLAKLEGGGTYDPHDWKTPCRTMQVAHEWIINQWDALENGAVVDVEYVLGETKTPKVSQHESVLDEILESTEPPTAEIKSVPAEI